MSVNFLCCGVSVSGKQGRRLWPTGPEEAATARRSAGLAVQRMLSAMAWHSVACSVAAQAPQKYTAEWARQHYPGGEMSDCVWAKAQVPGGFPAWEMCTYPKRYDVWISRRIQESKCFECDTVSLVLRLLKGARSKVGANTRVSRQHHHVECGSPDPISTPLLIDVGGNIGMYSLAAAAACFEAVAYEPVPLNAYKVMASARRNNMTGWVRVYTIGASDSYDLFDMGLSEANQGEATHMPVRDGTGGANSGGIGNGEVQAAVAGGGGQQTGGVIHAGLARIPVGPLSALIPPQPANRPIFIKMDVEGCALLACSLLGVPHPRPWGPSRACNFQRTRARDPILTVPTSNPSISRHPTAASAERCAAWRSFCAGRARSSAS